MEKPINLVVAWRAIVMILLLCAWSGSARRPPRTRSSSNNNELNNPANPSSASYHSLYNGHGHGLDGDPANPRGRSGHYARPGSGGSGANGINYYGGPVLVNGVIAYVIWYGNWANSPGLDLIPDFLRNLGGSGWWGISTTYTDSTQAKITTTVTYGGNVTDNYSQGTSLTDNGVLNVVKNALNGGLAKDPNGVYFVLTSPDVAETSGFCTQYCGWHNYANVGGTPIKYAFVGNPANCLSACSAQTTSPNGNPGIDAMISVIAHELTEAASDPQLNAWYDRRGYENADKCAWTFGSSTYVNGYIYNLVLPSSAVGTRQYLVQQNWVNAAGGYCAMQYP